MERRTFTIARDTWYRGHGARRSQLLLSGTSTPQMCCLGSIAKQCGATDDMIRGQSSPLRMFQRFGALLGYTDILIMLTTPNNVGSIRHTPIAGQMMQVNDDETLFDTERETTLLRLAATVGWDLVFVDAVTP